MACQDANCAAVDFSFAKVRIIAKGRAKFIVLTTRIFVGALLNVHHACSRGCLSFADCLHLLYLIRMLRGSRVFPAVLCFNLIFGLC